MDTQPQHPAEAAPQPYAGPPQYPGTPAYPTLQPFEPAQPPTGARRRRWPAVLASVGVVTLIAAVSAYLGFRHGATTPPSCPTTEEFARLVANEDGSDLPRLRVLSVECVEDLAVAEVRESIGGAAFASTTAVFRYYLGRWSLAALTSGGLGGDHELCDRLRQTSYAPLCS